MIVATGSSALVPDIEGLREARPWTNIEGTTATEVPPRLAILGGGVVGVELGSGVGCVRVDGHARAPGRAPDRARGAVRGRAGARGPARRWGGRPARPLGGAGIAPGRRRDRARRRDDDRGGRGAGRLRPPTRDRRDRPRDDRARRRTGRSSSATISASPGHEWLFAVGDVNGRALLTHMGKYQGRLVADTILGREGGAALGRGALAARDLHRPAGGRRRPHARRRAGGRASGSGTSTSRRAATPAARSWAAGAAGTSRIVVDEDRRVIVGATITGAEVAEALHAATIAVVAEVSLDDLWHAVPSFPTRSELWLKLLEAYGL